MTSPAAPDPSATAVPVIRVEGGDTIRDRFELPDHLMHLVLMFGNGLEGDVRLSGNTADAVDAARGLILGTGNCRPIDAPAAAVDAPLHRAGDECYRQHEDARVFLDPVPTGA